MPTLRALAPQTKSRVGLDLTQEHRGDTRTPERGFVPVVDKPGSFNGWERDT